LYVAAVLFASMILAAIERAALAAGTADVLYIVAALVVMTAGVAAYDRAGRSPVAALELQEDVPLPTQRLNLAG
jgi:hypothetical protein